MGDALDRGANLEVVEVCADEDEAGVGRRRPKAHAHLNRRVQSKPAQLGGRGDGRLFDQGRRVNLSRLA
jgi:hypothetical protein